MIYKLNLDERWRSILGNQELDPYMKDVELLLRLFAMLEWGNEYRPSMNRFLNRFAEHAKRTFDDSKIKRLHQIFDMFLASLQKLQDNPFRSSSSGNRFSIALFESAFVGCCEHLVNSDNGDTKPLTIENLQQLRESSKEYLQEGTTKQINVNERLKIARELLQVNEVVSKID
ncbi:MAG: hypothetical protein HC828_19635 [Blastochloris sp.]|nr:hypothetical protein [Blastochloris sp.]